MGFKGSVTEQNVRKALSGESIARNKYTYYAMKAREEGNEEIAEMFDKMAANEMFHAKIWFQTLNDGLGSSEKNLQDAANGEFEEWSSMYPDFAKKAREEGLEDIAVLFDRVASIEKDHEHQFLKMYAKMKSSGDAQNQQREEQGESQSAAARERVGYRCQFCGSAFETRPDVCDFCGAIGAFEQCVIEGK